MKRKPRLDARRRSRLSVPLDVQLRVLRLPTPSTEVMFHPDRKWRFDYCWQNQSVALEVDGGVWTQGRHTRGQGYINDCEKLNEAACLGWRVLRVTPQMVADGRAVAWLERLLR